MGGDLKNAANLLSVAGLSKPAQTRRVPDSLRTIYGTFVNLGLINDQGRYEAYAGPYELELADYAQSPWFKKVMAQGTYVSDVFLGYRGVLHFVAAVKVT